MHAPPTGLPYVIYYTALATIAIPANIVAIAILSRGRCGLSRCITQYLVSMAVMDLLVILTAVIVNRLSGMYFPGSFLSITPVCSVSNVLTFAARVSSVWLTVSFTFDRFIAISCQRLKTKYCTERTAAMVIGTICTLGCLTNIPFYFMHEPIYVVDNVPWYCRMKEIRYTSPAWTAFDWFDCILTPCLPFVLILLLNALTVRHILAASRARRRLRAHSNGETQCDLEIESRKKSIILLFTISGSFILLWMTYVAQFLRVRIVKDFTFQSFNDPRFILQESGNMLQLLSSCTNTFIYAAVQRKFREELKKAEQLEDAECGVDGILDDSASSDNNPGLHRADSSRNQADGPRGGALRLRRQLTRQHVGVATSSSREEF
ncbi:probable G-protein coupled receptor 139 [Narcine bancroftii]|uniref:probable G-protein coupled receptor 139 n=1 Tax=Narcine bancroftii TaxID=1343680 RepID=UPI0038311C5F